MNGLDSAARAFARQIASPALTHVMRGFSVVGEGLVLASLTTLAALFFLRAGRRHAALVLVVVMCGAGFLDHTLKLLVHRVRPEPLYGTPLPSTYSFPSGHALVSCCFFATLALLLARRQPSRPARVAIWLVAAFIAAMIGLSRVYLGVHYATDVVAGYAIAIVWMYAVIRFSRRYARHL